MYIMGAGKAKLAWSTVGVDLIDDWGMANAFIHASTKSEQLARRRE